jgi:hypothetical protein
MVCGTYTPLTTFADDWLVYDSVECVFTFINILPRDPAESIGRVFHTVQTSLVGYVTHSLGVIYARSRTLERIV